MHNRRHAGQPRRKTAGALIADRELIEELVDIDRLSERDTETVQAVLDTFILKNRCQRLAGDAAEQPVGEVMAAGAKTRAKAS